MNPVTINDRIARYDYIPSIEKEYDHFQNECYRILCEKYKEQWTKEKYEKAYKQLSWEMECIKKNDRVSVFVLGQAISSVINGNYWMGGRLASSIIAYLIGITHVDPTENCLYKESLWSVQGNRLPQLIFYEVQTNIKDICNQIKAIQGVADIICIEHIDETIIYVVPDNCDLQTYLQMDESELDIALGSIIFRWNVNLDITRRTFEDELSDLLMGGDDFEKAYLSAMRIKKDKKLDFKADVMEATWFLNNEYI